MKIWRSEILDHFENMSKKHHHGISGGCYLCSFLEKMISELPSSTDFEEKEKEPK